MPDKDKLRPAQKQIIAYKSGQMGVSAVPGAGKTFTLAHLAAKLIGQLAKRKNPDDSEVLIVTFTNAAVNNFKSRLSALLEQNRLLLSYDGYRIRTLHGLANDILRERPALVGLANDFQIADERASAALRRDSLAAWWTDRSEWFITTFVAEKFQPQNRRDDDELFRYALATAERFISLAKDREQTPEMLRAALDDQALDLPLARFGVEVYQQYQTRLSARGEVDFQDLSRLALSALRADPKFLKRLQKRWPFILEDEAQDSSKLQESLLRLLSAGKNWVRVGDPNQAINTTFTTADPQFLRDFLNDPNVAAHELSEAGRSAEPIYALANELARWASADHPVPELRDALVYQPILPVPKNSPQPNPPAAPNAVYLEFDPGKAISSERELALVTDSLIRWLGDHQDQTAAILVPDNDRGVKFVDILRANNVPYEELLSSTSTTRAAADQLHTVLAYLARPIGLQKAQPITLGTLYQKVWWPLHLHVAERDEAWLTQAVQVFNGADQAESFLWPSPAGTNSAEPIYATLAAIDPELAEDARQFSDHVRRWLDAITLPVDQLALIINQELFSDPADIALGFKFASSLRLAAFQHPTWRLPEFAKELEDISTRERRYFGLDTAIEGYQPTPGKVTVATMHQAKGLEWDRVYVTGVSSYAFPSMEPNDYYGDEKHYLAGRLNLKAEIAAQLDALLTRRGYEPGLATRRARVDFAAERLRLLYVAITRARRELMISWNTGRFAAKSQSAVNRPSLALVALGGFQGTNRSGSSSVSLPDSRPAAQSGDAP